MEVGSDVYGGGGREGGGRKVRRLSIGESKVCWEGGWR